MRFTQASRPLAIALAVACCSRSAAHALSGEASTESPEATQPDFFLSNLAGGHIVEFSDPYSASSVGLVDQHTVFEEHLAKHESGKIGYTMRESFNSHAFVGMSVRLDNPADVAALHNAPGVAKVYPIQHFAPPQLHISRASMAAVKVASKLDTWAPHVMTQVDRLHNKGLYGKGITVAILDTGVDYTHPALNSGRPAGQKCFGEPECTVIGGWDFVGDRNSSKPDNDPFSDCPGSEHGTFVAGILAANDTTLGFTGVAPHAKILAYRIFGCPPKTIPTDRVIAAMERAVADGADIINISFGQRGGFANNPVNLIASRISERGIPVIIAAGNEGSSGAFNAGDTDSAEFALTAASVQSTSFIGFPVKIAGVADLKELFLLKPKLFHFAANESSTLQFQYIEDACSPDKVPTMAQGKIALVFRGRCYSEDMKQNILDKGGKHVIVAQNPPTNSTVYGEDLEDQQSADIASYAVAVKLRSALTAGKKVNMTFDRKAALEFRPNNIDGGLLTDFSNFGPTNDMRFDPHLATPGGNIVSTIPVALGNYTVYSGTSMSAPFLSGVVAQYLSVHGKTPSVEIRSRLMSHSKLISETDAADSMVASVGRTGAGLVQAYDSIFATASAEPSMLALNDSSNFQSEHLITVKNIGKKVEKFTTSHLPAGTAQTANITTHGYLSWNLFPVPLTKQYAHVKVSPSTFTLAPGESRQIKVKVTPPAVDQAKFPLYSGHIKFSSSTARSTLTVPYMGLSASISARPVLDSTSEYFKNFSLPTLNFSTPAKPLSGERIVDLSNNDTAPSVIYRLTFGSPLVELSLVAPNISFAPTIKHSKIFKPVATCGFFSRGLTRRERETILQAPIAINSSSLASEIAQKHLLFSDVETIGRLNRSSYEPRSTDYPDSFSTFLVTDKFTKSDGTNHTIPEGRYRVLLRAQRAMTEAQYEASYDSWLSEAFTYRKASKTT